MRTSAVPHPDHAQRGFTLVELMVMLAVLALASTAVILAFPSREERLLGESDRLAARMAALRDLAIVEGQPMALVISPSGYNFERRGAAGWQALAGRGFEQHDWPEGVRLLTMVPQRVALDPIGMTSKPIAVTLTDGREQVRISMATNGEVARHE